MAPAGHDLGFDSRGDHRRPIRPSGRQHYRQQHMGGAAAATPGAARTMHHHPAGIFQSLPNPTNPGTAPRAQPPATARAGDQAAPKVSIDSQNILTYRHHQRGLFA
jgi:hypothetical protein